MTADEPFSHALLHRAAGQRLAVVDGDEEVTYYALRARVARIVEAIRGVEVVPGDRVLVFADPSAFAYAAYLAAMEAGGVAVPLATSASDAALDRLIERTAPRFALIHEDLAPRFARLAASGRIEHVIVGPDPLRISHVSGAFESEVDPEDLLGVAAIVFTSRGPGEPRAVRVGHDNLFANTEAIVEALSLRGGDRTVLVSPLHDSLGASVLHTHLWVGGTVHVSPRGASPARLLDALDASRATGLHGDPGSFDALIRGGGFGERELPHLRYLAQADGTLAPPLLDALVAQRVPEVYVTYGQAEATDRLSVLAAHEHEHERGSIGRGLSNTKLEVIGADGEPVGPGEVGEIVARGPGVTRGYLDDLEASARHFRDSALRTGDLATVNEGGFIYLERGRAQPSG